MNYSSFLRRFAAWLIDNIFIYATLITLAISVIILYVSIGKSLGWPENALSSLTDIWSWIFLLGGGIFSIGYYVYFTSNKGQTLGKKIFKIKVLRVDTNKIPGYNKGIIREVFGKGIEMFLMGFLGLGLLGYLWMIWDKKGQTWHDKIAGTVVINLR